MSFELVEQSGKISSLFSITSRDYVETLQNLNYEDSPKQYQLNIIATEVETGLKSTAEVIRHGHLLCSSQITVMTLSFRTDRSGQTVHTQIKLLLEEQSDQGLHYLLFHLHLFDEIP